MTYSITRGMGARGVPQQVVEAFQRLANQQRAIQDGNHRVAVAHEQGMETLSAYLGIKRSP